VLGWLEARDAFSVTLVYDDQTPIGVLLLPRGSRTRPITLEEARAARQLAERLSAVLGLSSTLVRFRERERRAEQRALELEAEKARLELLLASGARPRDALVEALAGAVRVANYSARARGTLELVERFAASGSDLALEAPVGTDALGWACAFHLAGPARGGPLVVVDAAGARAQAEEHWRHPSESPLASARGGTLLVLNASALPQPAQDALAIGLSRRAASELPHDPGFAFIATVAIPPQQLVDERQLSRALARFVLPNTLRLPVLLERAEDLRALVLDRLCRSGIHHEGQPLGIEPQALSLLVDYAWPGNDAELRLVVERAARFATGPRVRIDDLALAGFDVSVPAVDARSVAPLRRARSETVRTVLEPEEDRLERTTARRRRRR
jgi:DNA-binding NtrC family response regulator